MQCKMRQRHWHCGLWLLGMHKDHIATSWLWPTIVELDKQQNQSGTDCRKNQSMDTSRYPLARTDINPWKPQSGNLKTNDIQISLMTPHYWTNHAHKQFTAFQIHFCTYTVYDVTVHKKQCELWGQHLHGTEYGIKVSKMLDSTYRILH
jgi:hypothetical protein